MLRRRTIHGACKRDPPQGRPIRRALFLAALLALSLLFACLFCETERYAGLSGLNPKVLGKPIIGNAYAPWKSFEWMWAYDVHYSFPLAMRGGSGFYFNLDEPRWSREAFAAERGRWPWEGGASLLVFFIAGFALTKQSATSNLHGGARWATRRDLRRSTLITSRKSGVVLGQTPGWKRLLVHDGSEAVLAIGPPGSGKTNGIATPTLRRTWRESAIVFDPAAELAPATATARAKFTRVLVFDPRSSKSARFNPLAGFAPTSIDAIKTVLSSFMFDKDASEMGETSRYFLMSALELGVALIARSLELGGESFADAASHYYAGGWESDDEFFESLKKSKVAYVAETGSKFARMDHKTRSSVVGTLTQHLDLFRTPEVANVTASSDFSARMLREKPTTLYLVVREKDQHALNPLLRMVLTRLLDDLTEHKPADNEYSVLLMLDEFPLLRAPMIQPKLATLRKYRVRPVLLAQTHTQIRDYYGQNESVTGLCDVRVFFPSADRSTQELASETCGMGTQWAQTTNHDRDNVQTRSVHETARALLLPDELASMRNIIVWKKGELPILAHPVSAHLDTRFSLN